LRASEQLAADGFPTRVVALPCWRCFDDQPEEYRRDVLRRSVPSVSLEAGATLGWANYVDDSLGINTFGMSAPGKVVFEEYNIVPAAVVDHVEQVLRENR
jgi:transketolase